MVTVKYFQILILLPDSQPPVIAGCPSTRTVYTDASSDDVTVSWDLPTVTDNYDSSVTVTQTTGPPPGSRFSVSPHNVHTVTYEASDDSGNEAIPCIFQVIVQRRFFFSFCCLQTQ